MNRFLSFLGITRKSGNAVLGYNKNEETLRTGRLHLLIVSKDAAQNTKEKFVKLAGEAGVPLIEDFTPYELGQALGMDEIAVVGIKDAKMAAKLLSIAGQGQENNK